MVFVLPFMISELNNINLMISFFVFILLLIVDFGFLISDYKNPQSSIRIPK